MDNVTDAGKAASRVIGDIAERHKEGDMRIGVENEVRLQRINAPRTVSNNLRPRSAKRATFKQ